MHFNSGSYITADMEVSRNIKENPILLLVLENFGIFQMKKNQTFEELSIENQLNPELLVLICNLHSGYYLDKADHLPNESLRQIIFYLKNSHQYYLNEKYPEIRELIRVLGENTGKEIFNIIETYFMEYFNDVKEHIAYEEKIAFPYFFSLLDKQKISYKNFSVRYYKEHHTDIETSLEALKDIILHYIPVEKPLSVRRKLMMMLNELAFELKIHSLIEDMILIPLTERIENEGNEQ